MRTTSKLLGKRERIDDVEEPPVLVYALPHEAQGLHCGRIVLPVGRQ